MNDRPVSFGTSDCADCPIRHRAVCARCDEDELALLEKMKDYRSFKAGETIFWRGEPLEYVASIVTGVATLAKTMEEAGRRYMKDVPVIAEASIAESWAEK